MYELYQIESFFDFAEEHKTIRGGTEMYDVKGCYKYMTLPELLNYYFTKN